MTAPAPLEPVAAAAPAAVGHPRPRRPWCSWSIAYLAFSSVGNALVYYLTPTELLAAG